MIESATELCIKASEMKERMMLDQLGDLVKNNLIIWEEIEPQIIRQSGPESKFNIVMRGRLVLKDKEYIEDLKALVRRAYETLNQNGMDLAFNQMHSDHCKKWGIK